MSTIIQKRKYKSRYSDEEREKRRKAARTRANLNYQRGNEKYKEYKRMLWKKNVYLKIKNYVDKYTDKDIDDIINMDDYTSREMRTKFKEVFGKKIYDRYIR